MLWWWLALCRHVLGGMVVCEVCVVCVSARMGLNACKGEGAFALSTWGCWERVGGDGKLALVVARLVQACARWHGGV